MNPEKERPRRRAVEEVGVNGMTESPDHNGGDEQRHGEVEVLLQPSPELDCRSRMLRAEVGRSERVHRD